MTENETHDSGTRLWRPPSKKKKKKKEAKAAVLSLKAQELCESRGGRPGSPSLTVRTVSVDVKLTTLNCGRKVNNIELWT